MCVYVFVRACVHVLTACSNNPPKKEVNIAAPFSCLCGKAWPVWQVLVHGIKQQHLRSTESHFKPAKNPNEANKTDHNLYLWPNLHFSAKL